MHGDDRKDEEEDYIMNIHQLIVSKSVKSEVIIIIMQTAKFWRDYHLFVMYVTQTAGCGRLFITDGIWKTVFPHCMFRVEVSSSRVYKLYNVVMYFYRTLFLGFQPCLCQMFVQLVH